MLSETSVGTVTVLTTNNRGFRPEELVDRAVDCIIYVGDKSHPAIREQALAFREHIRGAVLHYMQQAVQSDRTTMAARLRDAGHPELVTLLEKP